MQEKFVVTGMTCAACSAHVEKAVSQLQGVDSVAVNLMLGSMLVDYDPAQVTAQAIVSAVENGGYGAKPAADAENPTIYLILPDGKKPAPVDPDQYSAYISSLNPKRILIVGDESIGPREYRSAIDPKYEVIDLGSKSWFVNAVSAATLFNTKKIQTKFEEKRAAAKTEGTEKVPAAEEK